MSASLILPMICSAVNALLAIKYPLSNWSNSNTSTGPVSGGQVTLITGAKQLIEVTAGGEIVWQLTLDATFEAPEAPNLGFYKAERVGTDR